MIFFDSHTHIYLEQFAQDVEIAITSAEKNNVKKIFLPAIDSSTHKQMLNLANQKNNCFAMMGLHPCSVNDDFKTELSFIESYLKQQKFAAIGEIGLDYYWDKTHSKEQVFAFEQQMQWALEYDYTINIHTRNATQETIELVKPFSKKGLRGTFHCFGGSYETAKQIIDMNFFLGIGGVVTYAKAGLQEVLPRISLNHLVLETDAPYLTPVPYRGKRNEPAYIKIIAQKIAEIMNEPLQKVADITSQNCLKLYNIYK